MSHKDLITDLLSDPEATQFPDGRKILRACYVLCSEISDLSSSLDDWKKRLNDLKQDVSKITQALKKAGIEIK